MKGCTKREPFLWLPIITRLAILLITAWILNKCITIKHNNMYKQNKPNKTSLKINNSYQGETIEKKVNRIVNNKEPIKDGAPLIYTERKEGVQPMYDVRTDRFELAIDGMDKVTTDKLAKREERAMGKVKKMETKIGTTEPIEGTGNESNTK